MALYDARLKALEQRTASGALDSAKAIIDARDGRPSMTTAEAHQIIAREKEGSLLRRIAEARVRVGLLRSEEP